MFNPKVSNIGGSGHVQSIDYTPPSQAVNAGDVLIINSIAYFAVADIAVGALGSLVVLGGVWVGNKKAAAFTAGDIVYYKTTEDPVVGTAGTGAFTPTSSAATLVGWAVFSALSGDQFVTFVKFPATSITNTITTLTTSTITDPGNAGAIAVTDSGHVDIVTAGAETRTLAAPATKGQMLLISMKTDGGDCVITCATTINQTGNNTITLNDAGDAVLLIAKTNGTNIRWSVVSNDGATLSTV